MHTVFQPDHSAFRTKYNWIFEKTPNDPNKAIIIHLSEMLTPLGPMLIGSTEQGICLLEFADRIRLAKEISDLQQLLQANPEPGNHPYIIQAAAELRAYFGGNLKSFSVPLHMPGNEFTVSVWQTLQEIPYGQTCSYKEQALKMKNPKAIRAIAATNGRNRLAIIVPCHRVIGSDGKMTGYAAGTDRKKWLLQLERSHTKSAENLLF